MPSGVYKRTERINYYQRKGGKKIKIVCLQCGKRFERYLYDIEKRDARYCSLECSHKATVKEKPDEIKLSNRYWRDKISINRIAKEYKVSKGLIYNWFKDMNIPTRSVSEAVIISGNNMTDKQKKEQIKRLLNSQKSGLSKVGRRNDIGIYVRSRWEANLCRYYNFNNIKWLYEPKTFYFNDSIIMGEKKIKRGTLSYTPDFYLPEENIYIEIKGYLRDKDKTKLRRFKKYYPKEFIKLKFIISDKYSKSKSNGDMINFLLDVLKIDFNEIISYKEIQKYNKLIPNWE